MMMTWWLIVEALTWQLWRVILLNEESDDIKPEDTMMMMAIDIDVMTNWRFWKVMTAERKAKASYWRPMTEGVTGVSKWLMILVVIWPLLKWQPEENNYWLRLIDRLADTIFVILVFSVHSFDDDNGGNQIAYSDDLAIYCMLMTHYWVLKLWHLFYLRRRHSMMIRR